MKKIVVLVSFLVFSLIAQGCAIYPPYGHSRGYNGYGSPNNGYYGGGGHHGWGGSGWGRHHGWGGDHDDD